MTKKIKLLASGLLLAVLVGSIGYANFSEKTTQGATMSFEAKRERLKQLEGEYWAKQKQLEEQVSKMPRNKLSEIDKADIEFKKLAEMPATEESIRLHKEIGPDLKEEVEMTFKIAKGEILIWNKKSAEKREKKLKILKSIEKDYRDGKLTVEQVNKELDMKLMRQIYE